MSGPVTGKRGRHHESYVSHMREATAANCVPELFSRITGEVQHHQ